MEAADYNMAWILYIVAGLNFTALVWYFSRKYFKRDLAFLTQGMMFALIFTPWYVFPDQDYLAPALMVFMMDTITISSEEGVRSLIPIFLATFVVLVVTVVRSIVARIKDRKRAASSLVEDESEIDIDDRSAD